jgi:hypothetical protein
VPTEPATEPLEPGSSLRDVAAALEWWLATESPRRTDPNTAVAPLLYRLGVELAAGLPSRAPADLSAADLGHCLAVLSVVPDDLHANWDAHFGTSISELVHARTLELVERLEGAPVGEGHAWLTVSG